MNQPRSRRGRDLAADYPGRPAMFLPRRAGLPRVERQSVAMAIGVLKGAVILACAVTIGILAFDTLHAPPSDPAGSFCARTRIGADYEQALLDARNAVASNRSRPADAARPGAPRPGGHERIETLRDGFRMISYDGERRVVGVCGIERNNGRVIRARYHPAR